jgi:shikimate dehydrogenase
MGAVLDGSTRLLGVIGDPIEQVRSPQVWSVLFQRNAINAACVPLHVRSADVKLVFGGLRAVSNVQGLIATIPHKPAMLDLVDEASPRARQVGAVNVVAFDAERRARGDILDGQGLVESLRMRGQRLDGRRALIVGAGGVGSAIAFALAGAGVREVTVSDIAVHRAEQLAARLASAGHAARVGAPDPHERDLIVNATPLGMRAHDPLPFDVERLEPEVIVADVVIQSALTPVLTAAQARGCFVHPGIYMSDAQVLTMAEFFGFGPGDWAPPLLNPTKMV